MSNSMDVIQVKYGNAETVSITEFLKLKPEQLTEAEKKVQEALLTLYRMNEKDPPLYLEFPPCHEAFPLTIDTTTCTTAIGAAAAYAPVTNTIQFKTIDHIEPLVVSLAHELKHAEQNSQELANKTLQKTYAAIQLRYLEEAQAYAFDARIQTELFNMPINDPFGETPLYQEAIKKYEALPLPERIKKAEEDTIIHLLPKLWNGSLYTIQYELTDPIDLNDDSHVEKIPESFHLSDRILEKLKETPKVAQTPIGKVKQFIKSGTLDNALDILEREDVSTFSAQETLQAVIQKGSTKQLNRFLKIKNAEGKTLLSPSDQKEIIRKDLGLTQNEIDSKIDLLFSLKEGKDPFLSETDIRQAIHYSVMNGNKKVFDSLISHITDREGKLKIEKLSPSESALSSFICGWTFQGSAKDKEQRYQILKSLLKLKDKNGDRFITDIELAFELRHLFKLGDINSMPTLLREITDGKGQLMLSGKTFGALGFLKSILEPSFSLTEEDIEGNRYKLLSEFKSLKDREGNLLITNKEYAYVLNEMAATCDGDKFAQLSTFCKTISNKLSLPCKKEELTDAVAWLKSSILSEETEEGLKRISFLFKLKDEDKVPLFSTQDLDELWKEASQDPQKHKKVMPIIKEYQKKRHFSNFLDRMSQKASRLFVSSRTPKVPRSKNFSSRE